MPLKALLFWLGMLGAICRFPNRSGALKEEAGALNEADGGATDRGTFARGVGTGVGRAIAPIPGRAAGLSRAVWGILRFC